MNRKVRGEVAIPWLGVHSWHLPGGTEENYGTPHLGYLGPPEHEARMLPAGPQHLSC